MLYISYSNNLQLAKAGQRKWVGCYSIWLQVISECSFRITYFDSNFEKEIIFFHLFVHELNVHNIVAGLSFVELNTESRFATAFYRSGKFILCELCVCLSMMKFWFVSPFSRERGDIWTVSYAFLWLTCGVSYTLMNSFNHLLLIKHTIGGVSLVEAINNRFRINAENYLLADP